MINPLTEKEINDIDEWMPGIANRLIAQARGYLKLREAIQEIETWAGDHVSFTALTHLGQVRKIALAALELKMGK